MKTLKVHFLVLFILIQSLHVFGQQKDSTVKVGENYITLSEIVVNNKLDVPSFIQRVKDDTSFYKAFRNLRVIGFTAVNDIRMLDKNGNIKAALRSKTRQVRLNNCRTMEVLDEKATGDIYDKDGQFNYYTAQMYAGLFFTKGKVCGENNVVKGHDFSTSGLSGMEKHKEQLKMLFFNPGNKINGLPFISNKTPIFDKSMADKYDMDIDFKDYQGQLCYVFTIKAKPNKKGDVVIQEMTTWFTEKNFDIVSRNYSLGYDAGVYDFNVDMEVQMSRFGNLMVPSLLKYNGNWKAIFKKRERGVFTATLFDYR
ncbi:MAG: hypothetical protein ABI123_08070 [Ginsengibacter sp.]